MSIAPEFCLAPIGECSYAACDCYRPSEKYQPSPTWEEVDAIRKGKSDIDLAERIWQLERELAQAKHDLERAVANHAADLSVPSATGTQIEPFLLTLIRVLDDLEENGNGWNPATMPENANDAERKFRDMLATNWTSIRRLIPVDRTAKGE